MSWCPIHEQHMNGRCIYCCGHAHVLGPVIQVANILVRARLLMPFVTISKCDEPCPNAAAGRNESKWLCRPHLFAYEQNRPLEAM